MILGAVAAIAVAAFVVAHRAARAAARDPIRELTVTAERALRTSQPTSELVTAWVQFLRDHVTEAVNGLNNRLNAISLLAQGLQHDAVAKPQVEVAERIIAEATRAANITGGLLHRLSSDAPDIPPPAWRVLRDRVPRSARILLVEGDESNRTVVTRLLRDLGHHVVAVINGHEAWDALASGPVDCILCDVRLGGIGGRSLYEQVEEQMPHLARRFVFVTGDYANPDSYEFLHKSGQPVVGKPYEIATLLGAVAAVLTEVGSTSRAVV